MEQLCTQDLHGNPLGLSAAKAVLGVLCRNEVAVYVDLWRRGERLRQGLENILRACGFSIVTAGGGPVFHLFYGKACLELSRNLGSRPVALQGLCASLLDEGVLVLRDGRWYLSTARREEDIGATLAAAERAATGS